MDEVHCPGKIIGIGREWRWGNTSYLALWVFSQVLKKVLER